MLLALVAQGLDVGASVFVYQEDVLAIVAPLVMWCGTPSTTTRAILGIGGCCQ
jgi:hypothetical protein